MPEPLPMASKNITLAIWRPARPGYQGEVGKAHFELHNPAPQPLPAQPSIVHAFPEHQPISDEYGEAQRVDSSDSRNVLIIQP
jgi:hypothetical protein